MIDREDKEKRDKIIKLINRRRIKIELTLLQPLNSPRILLY